MIDIKPDKSFLISHKKWAYEKKVAQTTRGKVLWFTGLSGAGKTTIAEQLEKKFREQGVVSKILDGDELRKGINKDLDFTELDRLENIRRTAEVAKLFSESGITVIVSFITPTQIMRNLAKEIIGDNFLEVYVSASLEVCELRDVKGLYKKARAGEILDFTGISAPYEIPFKPDIIINTENILVKDSVNFLLQTLQSR